MPRDPHAKHRKAIARKKKLKQERLSRTPPPPEFPPLNLNKAALRQDGFNEHEIAWLEQHLTDEMRQGSVDQQAELVALDGRPMLVCRSIADALERLRPGVRLTR